MDLTGAEIQSGDCQTTIKMISSGIDGSSHLKHGRACEPDGLKSVKNNIDQFHGAYNLRGHRVTSLSIGSCLLLDKSFDMVVDEFTMGDRSHMPETCEAVGHGLWQLLF